MAAPFISSITSTIRVLRLTPFDTSTEEGRSQERNRRIAWTSVSAATAKGMAALTMLVLVPVTLAYLGPERFGLWMTVTATIAMLHFADFGLSNGLMNAVAHAKGKDDIHEIQQAVSNGIIMLLVAALGFSVIFGVVYSSIPWAAVFNAATPPARADTGPLVLALTACFLVNLPFAATQKVQLGLQRGYLANFWETLGSFLGLMGIIIAVQLDAGLTWIALAMAGAPVLTRILNSLVFFGLQMPSLRPQLNRFESSTVSRLFRIGALFFVLQLAVIIGVQSDNIVIARILGAETVAGYDVAFKLTILPTMFIGFIVVAQWPAYGEASRRGDSKWIRDTFLRTMRLGLSISLPYSLILLVFGKQIIGFWAGPEVVPSNALLAGMAIWTILASIGAMVSALLNGLHVVRFQAITAILFATTNILLSIFLVYEVGVYGAIYGSVIAYVVCTLLPYWVYVRRLLRASIQRVGTLPA